MKKLILILLFIPISLFAQKAQRIGESGDTTIVSQIKIDSKNVTTFFDHLNNSNLILSHGLGDTCISATKIKESVIFDNELLNQTVSTDSSSKEIDISGFSYSNAPDVIIANLTSWNITVGIVTNSTVTVKVPLFGDFSVSTATFNLFFRSND